MKLPRTLSSRIINLVGMLCLGMSFALLPAGVNVVRAQDAAEKLMSVDPLLVEGDPDLQASPPAAPALGRAEAMVGAQPGTSAAEAPSGVIVLNTRGYNYGPPPAEIDPAAMQREVRKP